MLLMLLIIMLQKNNNNSNLTRNINFIRLLKSHSHNRMSSIKNNNNIIYTNPSLTSESIFFVCRCRFLIKKTVKAAAAAEHKGKRIAHSGACVINCTGTT